MSIKMIVTDLDKTLLKTDKSISDKTIRMLQNCKEKGIKLVFATARSECDCKQYINLINPDAIISSCGSSVRRGCEVLYRSTIDVAMVNHFLLECLKHDCVRFITAYTDKGYLINIPANQHSSDWGEYNPNSFYDFSHGLDCDAYKIAVEVFHENVAKRLGEGFATINMVKFSDENSWYLFTNKAATKWNGVVSLSNNWGILPENIVAFGDDFSDIEMLRKCGLGVAVGNAINEVKVVADYICDTNDEDGVATWLKHFAITT